MPEPDKVWDVSAMPPLPASVSGGIGLTTQDPVGPGDVSHVMRCRGVFGGLGDVFHGLFLVAGHLIEKAEIEVAVEPGVFAGGSGGLDHFFRLAFAVEQILDLQHRDAAVPGHRHVLLPGGLQGGSFGPGQAEEMPNRVLHILGIHGAVQLELIHPLLEFTGVIQGDPALPVARGFLREEGDHGIEVGDRFLDPGLAKVILPPALVRGCGDLPGLLGLLGGGVSRPVEDRLQAGDDRPVIFASEGVFRGFNRLGIAAEGGAGKQQREQDRKRDSENLWFHDEKVCNSGRDFWFTPALGPESGSCTQPQSHHQSQMKKVLIVMALTAFAAVSTGIAAPGEGKGKGKKPPMTPEQRAEGMIKNLDKNADGKLDKAELAAQPAPKPKEGAPAPAKPAPTPEERATKMLERGDTNKDGALDKAELTTVLTPAPKKPKAN